MEATGGQVSESWSQSSSFRRCLDDKRGFERDLIATRHEEMARPGMGGINDDAVSSPRVVSGMYAALRFIMKSPYSRERVLDVGG